MSDGGEKNGKGLIYRSLASLSWPLRFLTRWCRSTWSWSFWRDWPAGIKCLAVIWMLLPFPHLYEILKVWLPWIHPLLGLAWNQSPRTGSSGTRSKFIRPCADKHASHRGLVWCVLPHLAHGTRGQADPSQQTSRRRSIEKATILSFSPKQWSNLAQPVKTERLPLKPGLAQSSLWSDLQRTASAITVPSLKHSPPIFESTAAILNLLTMRI